MLEGMHKLETWDQSWIKENYFLLLIKLPAALSNTLLRVTDNHWMAPFYVTEDGWDGPSN
jgi:hypothetical protein